MAKLGRNFALLLCGLTATRCGRATFDLLEPGAGSGGTDAGQSGQTMGGALAGTGGTSAGAGGASGGAPGGAAGMGIGGGGREGGGGGSAGKPVTFPSHCDLEWSAECTDATCERCTNDGPGCVCERDLNPASDARWCSGCPREGCGDFPRFCDSFTRRCGDLCDPSDPNACPGDRYEQGGCRLFTDGRPGGWCVECWRDAACRGGDVCYEGRCVECREPCDCDSRFGTNYCRAGRCVCRNDDDCVRSDSRGRRFVCVDEACVAPQ